MIVMVSKYKHVILYSSLFVPFKSTVNLAISNNTSDFIAMKIKAKFVKYKNTSFISTTDLVDYELLIKTCPSKSDENNGRIVAVPAAVEHLMPPLVMPSVLPSLSGQEVSVTTVVGGRMPWLPPVASLCSLHPGDK
jgi:hypothetical protein